MPTPEQPFETYSFVRRALQRHRRKGMIVFAVGTVLAVAGTMLLPQSYYSQARLLVRFGPDNQLDSADSGGQLASINESHQSEINTVIETLRSQAIFDRVVTALGPNLVLYGNNQGTVDGGQTGEANQPPTSAHQTAVARLVKDVSIYTPNKSNTITVAYRASSPALAQQIVAKLVEVYQEVHVRMHRSPGSYEQFEQQAKESLAAWQAAAAELHEIKNRPGIVTTDGSRKNLEEQIADIDSQRLFNQAALSASRAKIASLEGLLSRLPQTRPQAVAGPNASVDGMRQTLTQLQAQEQELAAKMKADHPRLAAVRQLIRDLNESLMTQPPNEVQETESLHPAWQELERTLLEEKSHADSLTERDRSLVKAQQQLRGELQQLSTQAIAIDELTQRVAVAEANHKECAQKLEQARANGKLDDERISSLNLVQPATYVTTPSGPLRLHVLALGLTAAALGGLVTTLAAAWFNPLLITGDQLARALDLPLAGIVPRVQVAPAA